ncbi:hypothetical protein JCM17823_06370 [Halorubrum gandharaense]
MCDREHDYEFQTYAPDLDLCKLCDETFEWSKSGKQSHISREEIHRLRKRWIAEHPDAAVISDLTQLSRGDMIAVTDSNYVTKQEFWVYSVSRAGFTYANCDEVGGQITATGTPDLSIQRLDESPPARSVQTDIQTFLDAEQVVRYNTDSFKERVHLHRFANGIDS